MGGMGWGYGIDSNKKTQKNSKRIATSKPVKKLRSLKNTNLQSEVDDLRQILKKKLGAREKASK